MKLFSHPSAIPSADDSGSPIGLPQPRAAGRFSPTAKNMLECTIAGALGVVSAAGCALALYLDHAPAFVIEGLCAALCIRVIWRCFSKLHRLEEEQADVVYKVIGNLEAEITDLRLDVDCWRNYAGHCEGETGVVIREGKAGTVYEIGPSEYRETGVVIRPMWNNRRD